MANQVEIPDSVMKLVAILSPEHLSRAEKLRNGESKLAHYTSGENALAILKSQQFWLRNVRCMNDYTEVQHGINLLLRVFGADENARRDRLYLMIDQIAAGAAKSAIDSFDTWIGVLPDGVFIGCLSEFDPQDQQGRLSMWRAYGSKGSSVALVMNSDPFVAETDTLKAYSLPVLYLTDEEFAQRIDLCLDQIEASIEEFRDIDPQTIENMLFY